MGEVACIVLNAYSQTDYANNNLKPTATQVYLGIDRNNAAAVSAKKIDAATTDTSGTTTKAKSLLMDLQRELLTPLSVPHLTDMPHSQATLPMLQMITTPQLTSQQTENLKKTTTTTLPPALEYLYS